MASPKIVDFENRSGAYALVCEQRKRRKPPFAGRHGVKSTDPSPIQVPIRGVYAMFERSNATAFTTAKTFLPGARPKVAAEWRVTRAARVSPRQSRGM